MFPCVVIASKEGAISPMRGIETVFEICVFSIIFFSKAKLALKKSLFGNLNHTL
jgi:hypothetical protein